MEKIWPEFPLNFIAECVPEVGRYFPGSWLVEWQARIKATVTSKLNDSIFDTHPNKDGECDGAIKLNSLSKTDAVHRVTL
jgi:hypothetical protein